MRSPDPNANSVGAGADIEKCQLTVIMSHVFSCF